MDDGKPEVLKHSALGTKDYQSWDEVYEREIANHADDPDDEGTIWFADSGAEEKMLEYLEDLPLSGADGNNSENENLRILDLGSGNGHMLFALRDEGWSAELIGVDYSEPSVQLARRIHETRSYTNGELRVQFELFDILSREVQPTWLGRGFDVVLDKGTFDAISLNDVKDEDGKIGAEVYGERIQHLIRRGGFLLVTSCNWTTDELQKWLQTPELAYHGVIKYPSFTFGGVQGQSVSSVCFKKT